MKITDLKSAVIGQNIVLRIVTDKGIDGYAEVEEGKDFVRPLVPFYRDKIVGCDPTDVERVMRRIRRLGAFKPWGKIVSSIEMALWDVAGKNAGLPVYKLLGGKVRDEVRVYNGSFQNPNPPYPEPETPEQAAENILALSEIPEGFTIVKSGYGFHHIGFFENRCDYEYAYNTYPKEYREGPESARSAAFTQNGSLLTEKGFNYMVEWVARVKSVIKDRVGLALDCGPGMTAVDALRFAKAMEPYHLLWLEDMVTGDYTPYTLAHVYRDITAQTTTPIHTGEQIYLRENFIELIEKQAVNVVGPDPADVGGIAELKWICEYANLHGVLMAPHGTIDGLFGLAALTQVCATLPQNFIAFEYPCGRPEWWYDIVEGLPDPVLRNGHVKVLDRPGLGIEFNINKASEHLSAEDRDFFR
jgi:L-alanine-DL-glutamate epimerase-like enolase superfamily enzyme